MRAQSLLQIAMCEKLYGCDCETIIVIVEEGFISADNLMLIYYKGVKH